MSHHTSEGTVPWPDDVASEYRRLGYWEDRTLWEVLHETAQARPDKVAVVDGPTRLTYAELFDRSEAAARRLLALGLEPDDRLLVQLPNGWEFVALTLACFRSGIIPVMALPAHRRHELNHLAGVSEARAIAAPDRLRDFDHQALAHDLCGALPDLDHVIVLGKAEQGATALEDLLAPGSDGPGEGGPLLDLPHPDAPACFLISGGTTGLPKLIVRTHNDYVCNIRATAATAALEEASVYLGTLPASHNFPLACPGILGALLLGGTAVMLPSPAPERVFATIEAEGVTIAAAVPAVAQAWLDHQRAVGGDQLRSLEVLQVGGSRLPDEIARHIGPEMGCHLQQVFGMAEGLINTTRLDDSEEVICTTQGRPVHPGDEVRILDVMGRELPHGQPGAIYTRGPYTPRGYYRAAEHNAQAFLDGWYGSGDVVVQHADGNLVVHGRDKDMINRAGEKISAEAVESLVYEMDSVAMVAAVSMPDERLGERVCIYVVPRPGSDVPTLEDVVEHFRRAEVAAFMLPERLELVEELPTTKVGKIDKRRLRDDITERLASAQQSV
ncbi:(2,3-dihydroxybenzoyl)adenylate synthase [Aeromicrobium sp. CF4.19]|uniref:(2,3-dihydroxybenzoyl)adenylate synthase n=1 Tax=Aeromicrobium sp. CF4.19 TaxID=3373082 RepID=UPI003EE70707